MLRKLASKKVVKPKEVKAITAKSSLSDMEIAVKKAIDDMKSSAYGVTAIKVELEAQLGRNSVRGDNCGACDGTGDTFDEDEDEYISCTACGGGGRVAVGSDGVRHNWSSEDYCKTWLDSNVSPEARSALIFGKFYRDGSVDSEYTFTMPIDHPEYCVEYIRAWKKMADTIGNGNITTGAGMHIAILNDARGRYPEGNGLSHRHLLNFKYCMDKLMPALFFLGSPDHKSRPLQFRMPEVGVSAKYSAISAHMRVFEYRVFETCYDKPEAFYDMFCTIANSLKFYTSERVELPFFNKIGKLGVKDGTGLDRFYYTSKHLEALELGIEELRPSYKTFEQLKKERGFKLTKQVLVSQEKKQERQFEIGYNEAVAIMKHNDESRVRHVTEEYKRMVKMEGQAWMIKNYGTLSDFVADRARPTPPISKKKYIDQCKNMFAKENVAVTITV